MLIGIISDSHDHQDRLKDAVAFFNDMKVGHVIHAGDIVSPFSMFILNDLVCPWNAVFGNNDGERRGLSMFSEGRVAEPPLELVLDGKRLWVVHDLAAHTEGAEGASHLVADVIIHGHTHRAGVELRDGRLFVNPGEACGYLTGNATVAVLDSTTMTAGILEIPRINRV